MGKSDKFYQKGQARLQSPAPARQSPYGSSRMADGRSNSGQALLIVVLVMVVGLTIGLSIVSKSITNVRTTTEEANSAQALAAAEAGVAQAIQTNQGVPIGSDITYGNNASFTSSLTQASGQTTVILNGGSIVPKDEGVDLWFAPHDSSGLPDYSFNGGNGWPGASINIYWGDSSSDCNDSDQAPAALEILIIRAPSIAPTSVRYALDPCGSRGNNFTNPNGGNYNIGGRIFRNTLALNSSGGLIARIIPIYKNAIIAVVDNTSTGFPSQGAVITSTGKAKDTTIQRKLNVFQGFSYLPIEYVSYGIVVHK